MSLIQRVLSLVWGQELNPEIQREIWPLASRVALSQSCLQQSFKKWRWRFPDSLKITILILSQGPWVWFIWITTDFISCDSVISSRDAPSYLSSHKSFQYSKEGWWVHGKNFQVRLELDPDSAFQLTYTFRLPRWLSGKESTCNPRDAGDEGLIAGSGPGFNSWLVKLLWRRKWQPTPVFLLGKSHGQRSWQATVYGLAKESDTT